MKKFFLALIAVVIIAIIGLRLPTKLPYSVESFGKVVPIKQWILARGADGELVASTVNNQTGMSEGYSVLQISRGETMRFSLNSSIMNDGFIAAGDTIGAIYSSEAEERLASLNGKLLTAQANLVSNTGGRKEAVIREARQRLAYARTAFAEQKKTLRRLAKLHQKELISGQVYDNAAGKANLLEVEISIAKSELDVATTGQKQEKINLIHSRVEALQQEIAILEKRLHSFSIIAPFAGKVSKPFSADEILIISDVSAFVAFIPVSLNDCTYISKANGVSMGPVTEDQGQVLSLDNRIQIINGEQARVATVLLPAHSGELLPGMISQCTISCEPVTMTEYIKRFLNSFLG